MIDINSTRADVDAEYTIRDGRISAPGKFEDEPWFAPILYAWDMEGWCEYIAGWNVHDVTDDDRTKFGLDPATAYLATSETDQGFYMIEEWTQDEYDLAVEADLAAQPEEDA